MGVIVTIAVGDDPDRDAVANVMYRISGSGLYHQGFPLSCTTDTRFVGSLFWLEPGTAYDVRVSFTDLDGDPLNGATVEATASTRVEITIRAPNHSYYVSPTGSGTACSIASPCSLVEGLNQAQPGEEVILRGGVYYQGEINLPCSGHAGAPIVIRSYTDEMAILDGSDTAAFTWAAVGNGIYRTTINVADVHLVLANGQRLYRYQSLQDLQAFRWGLPGFYLEGTALYVHLTGDADSNLTAMVISCRSYAFKIEQNSIYILNLTFRHYGQGFRIALYLRNGSDNLVQGCKFAVNDINIALKLDSLHRNVIQDNEFYDTIYEWPWDAVKGLAPVSSLEIGSIRFSEPNPDQPKITSRGTIIRRNVLDDFFDGFGVCPTQTQAEPTNETDIYENLVYRVGDDGMETDGNCSNVRIWKNTFHDVLVGVSLAPARIGPTYAIRNLIYRTGATRDGPFGQQGPCCGTAFKFQYQYPGSGPMYLFNNTADAALPNNNAIYITESVTWSTLISRNNIWVSNNFRALSYNADDPADFDYDELLRASGPPLVGWNGISYNTLAEFSRAAIGQEQHGLSVPPGFTNSAGGDYSLSPNSQLVDAGVFISRVSIMTIQEPHPTLALSSARVTASP